MASRIIDRFTTLAVTLGAAASLAQASMFDVSGGQQVVGEGTHFVIPWLQRAIIYDVRTRPRNISNHGSRDIKCRRGKLPQLHQTLGPDYDERVLPSIGNEVLKVVARFDASELITHSWHLRQRISTFREDVSIVYPSRFRQNFTSAVEQKQIAQQEAERAKFVVEKAEQEMQPPLSAPKVTLKLPSHFQCLGQGRPRTRRVPPHRGRQDIAQILANSPNVTYLPSSGAHGGAAQGGLRCGRAGMLLNLRV
ncbi:hypothetical protein BCR44DRAFT_1439320, partial [Catenaria anguillulae PL171]